MHGEQLLDDIRARSRELGFRDFGTHGGSRADPPSHHLEQLVGIVGARPLLMGKDLQDEFN